MAAPESTSHPSFKQPSRRLALQRHCVRTAEISDVLDSVTDSVQVIDANWRIAYMNKAARRTMREQGMDPGLDASAAIAGMTSIPTVEALRCSAPTCMPWRAAR